MPLSEHEERILAEIERRLVEEDPRFVERARRANAERRRTWQLRGAVALFVVGLFTLFGLTLHLAFGLVGFATMLFAVVVGARTVLGTTSDVPSASLVARVRRLLSRRENAS